MSAGGQDIRAGKAFVELYLKNSIGKGLAQARKAIDNFGAKTMALGNTMMRVGAIATGMGAVITAALAAPIKAASDLAETISKFNAVFGDQTDAVREWAEDYRNQVGRSKKDTLNALATFQSFFLGLGLGADKARDMSKELTQLAVDFGSFHNLEDTEAMQRFISALSGSGEVLAMFGVNIMEAALNAKLLEKGFPKISQGATETQKVLARMDIIRESMGKQGAIGDAIKTADSFSNRMKAMKASIGDTAVAIGQALMPALTPVVGVISQFGKAMAKWIDDNPKAIETIAKITLGVTAAGAAIAGMGATIVGFGYAAGIVGTVGAAFGSLLGLVAPVIIPLTAIGVTVAAIVHTARSFPSVMKAAGDATAWFSSVLGSIGQFFQPAIDVITKSLSDVQETFGITWSGIMSALQSGNLEAAATIAFDGVKLAALQIMKPISDAWASAAWSFATVWTNAQANVAKGFTNMFASVQSTWADLSSKITGGWKNVGTFIKLAAIKAKSNLDLLANDDAKNAGEISEKEWSRRRSNIINQAARDATTVAGGRIGEMNTEEADRQKAVDKIEADRKGTVGELDAQLGRDQAGIDDRYNKSIDGTQSAIDAAKKRLKDASSAAAADAAAADLIAAAKAEAKAGADQVNKAATSGGDVAAGATIPGKSTFGSFSAAALSARGNGGGGVQAAILNELKEHKKLEKEKFKLDEKILAAVKANQGQLVTLN